jgi:hypothetical protein
MVTATAMLATYGVSEWLTLVALSAVLAGLVIALCLFVLWARKRCVERQTPPPGEPMTLGDLRELRDKGMIDEAEHARLRERVIHEARASAGLAGDVSVAGRSDKRSGRAEARPDTAPARERPAEVADGSAAEPPEEPGTPGKAEGGQ